MSPRVIIAANTSWYIYNFRLPLIQALKAKGCEIICLAARDQFTHILEESGVEFHQTPYSERRVKILKELSLFIKTLIKIYSLKPAIVLSFTMRANIYTGISRWLFKFDFIPNISGLGAFFGDMTPKYFSVRRAVLKFSLLHSKNIFVQNEYIEELFIGGRICRQERIVRINGSGVDSNKFKYSPPSELAGIRVGMFSRLIRSKGVLHYIEASKDDSISGTWTLGGQLQPDGPDCITREELDGALINSRVTFLGAVADVRTTLENIDVLVLPTYYPEGIPKILLEGLSAGKIIITTNTPGCNETVIEGRNGFYCEPKSTDSLVRALRKAQRLTAAERIMFSRCSRRLAEAKFSLQENHQLYMKVIGF